MAITHPVQMIAVYPMVITRLVQTVLEFLMVLQSWITVTYAYVVIILKLLKKIQEVSV
jgi:hypothetical protein